MSKTESLKAGDLVYEETIYATRPSIFELANCVLDSITSAFLPVILAIVIVVCPLYATPYTLLVWRLIPVVIGCSAMAFICFLCLLVARRLTWNSGPYSLKLQSGILSIGNEVSMKLQHSEWRYANPNLHIRSPVSRLSQGIAISNGCSSCILCGYTSQSLRMWAAIFRACNVTQISDEMGIVARSVWIGCFAIAGKLFGGGVGVLIGHGEDWVSTANDASSVGSLVGLFVMGLVMAVRYKRPPVVRLDEPSPLDTTASV